jgi:hypothetical protein
MLKIFELPRMDPASLTGYREDKAASKRFEWRFRLPSLIGILMIFGGAAAAMMGKIDKPTVFVLLIAGFLIIFLTLFWMFKATAYSESGHPMTMYWSSQPKPGNLEALYVCKHSRTYFIRVWGTPSRD